MSQPWDGRYDWLDDNPQLVGGHDVDIAAAPSCLYSYLRNAYRINEVPPKFLEEWSRAVKLAQAAEEVLKSLIEAISSDLHPATDGRRSYNPPEKREANDGTAASPGIG